MVAENRATKIRSMYTGTMTKEEAEAWVPSSSDKKYFRYFKVAKYPYKDKKRKL